jgi:antitoxin HicB
MGRIRLWNSNGTKKPSPDYEFTVVLLPVFDTHAPIKSKAKLQKNSQTRLRNPHAPTGYQVSVPALPGVITYGRTKEEAWTMAADAIRCHIEGLQKDGEPIPNENDSQFRKLRISA